MFPMIIDRHRIMSLRLQQEYQSLYEDSMSTYVQPPRFVDAMGGLNMQVWSQWTGPIARISVIRYSRWS